MREQISRSKKILRDTFEPFLDRFVKAQTVKVMIMGPNMVSRKPSANLRRKLVELCKAEGLSVVAEHSDLMDMAMKKLKSGYELTIYEHAVAGWSDLVVLIPDSAGSIAELGYFACLDKIPEKMMIFLNGKHEPNKEGSYIWQGPARAAGNKSAHVAYVDYSDVDEIWATVKERIEKKKADKIRKSLESLG